MKFLPFVFTCDDKYFKYTAVVITSILVNLNKNCHYEFNIVSDFISDENKSKAESYIAKYKNASIKFIELKDIDDSQFFLNSYMNATTYYRFYVAEIFKKYDYILYLDSDLIVNADLSNLLDINLEDKLALCANSSFILRKIRKNDDPYYPISYFTDILKMPEPKEYFNAGVIIFNLNEMRKQNIQEKLFQALDEIKEPKLQDQDILNSVFSRNGGAKIIDQKYNLTRQNKISQSRILLNAIQRRFGLNKNRPWLFYIYHYVGKEKPWMKHDIDSHLFYYYAVKSPFYVEIVKENPSVKLNSLTKLLYKII